MILEYSAIPVNKLILPANILTINHLKDNFNSFILLET